MVTLARVREGITPAEALRCVLAETPVLGPETVATRDALGRVLAEDVVATRRLPLDLVWHVLPLDAIAAWRVKDSPVVRIVGVDSPRGLVLHGAGAGSRPGAHISE